MKTIQSADKKFMQILVNGESLNFEMSQKTTLTDILGHINEWARGDQAYILDYRINGEAKDPQKEYHSENIDLLEVTLGSAENLLFEHILELEAYLDKMGNHLALILQQRTDHGGDIELSTEVVDGLAWIGDSVDTVVKQARAKPVTGLDLLYSAPDQLCNELSAVLQVLIEIRQSIELWKKNIIMRNLSGEERAEHRSVFLSELEESLERLENIVQNFTVGKEAQALAELETYLTWLSEGLSLLESSAEEGAQEESRLSEIKNVLSEIHDALQNADFVTLADILDYDLRDMISELAQKVA